MLVFYSLQLLIINRIIEEFRNLAWTEVKPKYLDYEYCQILLIGENIDKAVEPTKKDQKHDKETPQEEIDKLEHEDELRIQHLHGKCQRLPDVARNAMHLLIGDLKILRHSKGALILLCLLTCIQATIPSSMISK